MEPTPVRPYPLSVAATGLQVRVLAVTGSEAVRQRLIELGLHVGSLWQVRQNQGAGLVLGQGQTRLALGLDLACCVQVLPVAARAQFIQQIEGGT
ncbi:MAG: FeoA family protein [Halothiobacillaceae bacterium]